MIIITYQTCTAGIHAHFYMFIKLNPIKTKVLTYISRLHAIIIIITSFKPKSNMNHHLSSTYIIIIIYILTCPDYKLDYNHLISWPKQQIIHQIPSKMKVTY